MSPTHARGRGAARRARCGYDPSRACVISTRAGPGPDLVGRHAGEQPVGPGGVGPFGCTTAVRWSRRRSRSPARRGAPMASLTGEPGLAATDGRWAPELAEDVDQVPRGQIVRPPRRARPAGWSGAAREPVARAAPPDVGVPREASRAESGAHASPGRCGRVPPDGRPQRLQLRRDEEGRHSGNIGCSSSDRP